MYSERWLDRRLSLMNPILKRAPHPGERSPTLTLSHSVIAPSSCRSVFLLSTLFMNSTCVPGTAPRDGYTTAKMTDWSLALLGLLFGGREKQRTSTYYQAGRPGSIVS